MLHRFPALALVLLLGCGSADSVRADFGEADDAAEFAQAEEILRAGLEKHPDDVELLLTAGGFYLRGDPADFYKPRLALHYAMRATRATQASDRRATDLLKRAQLAAGGIAAGDDRAGAILERGLERLGKPEAEPIGFRPFDPDLLAGGHAEVQEQLRRWKARDEAGPLCPGGMAAVPAGVWDLDERTEVPAFCVEERPSTTPALRLAVEQHDGWCADRGLRACSPPESAVACGPLGSVLPDHAACTDPVFVRCCADVAGDPAIP